MIIIICHEKTTFMAYTNYALLVISVSNMAYFSFLESQLQTYVNTSHLD